jgi:hypothetical protein
MSALGQNVPTASAAKTIPKNSDDFQVSPPASQTSTAQQQPIIAS